MRSVFSRFAILSVLALGLAACFGGGGGSRQTILVTVSGATGGPIVLGGSGILIFDGSPDGAIVWTVNGDFTCLGEIDLRDAGFTVRIVVEGNAVLSCEILLPPDGDPPAGGLAAGSPAIVDPPSVLEVVVGGRISIGDGFSPFGTGSVHITDDATMLKTPSEYDTDATTDDPTCGDVGDPTCDLFMPPPDTTPPTALSAPPASAPPAPQASHCVPGAPHNLSGTLAPMPAQQNLPQGSPTAGPIVVAVWVECDVIWGEDANGNPVPATINPPTWNARPDKVKDTSGDPAPGPATETGANGRKGLTLNVRTNGKMTFRGVTTWNLMDGGDGQCAVVTGAGATATGGNGGKSGNMKARAGGGFDFSAGSLLINPGVGGSGGCAVATGIDGVVGCPGTPGFSAVATGGDGGENRKKMTVRGFDPTDNISMGPLTGGIGGDATATGGKGGDGQDGPPGCDGGLGAPASATGGKGGNVSYSYSGPGAIAAPILTGGDGGDSISDSGRGGHGGDWIPFNGGSGANGGDSTAVGGLVGTGSTGGPPTPGTANADQSGVGGDCGNYFGGFGIGGDWTQTVAGAPAGNGKFADGNPVCNPPLIVFVQPAAMTTPTDMDDVALGGPTTIIRGTLDDLDAEDWATKQIPIEMVQLELCSVDPLGIEGGLLPTTIQVNPGEIPLEFKSYFETTFEKCWVFGWIDPLVRLGGPIDIGVFGPGNVGPFDHDLELRFTPDPPDS